MGDVSVAVAINGARLRNTLETLGKIGCQEGGGVTRISYTQTFREGRDYVAGLMAQADLEVRIDPIGNLIGVKKGRTDRRIILGSHIDSVPNGGIFDGCLGVLAAVECLRVLKDVDFEHTIEVVAFVEEEGNVVGSMLGSRAYAGIQQTDERLERRLETHGLSYADVIDSKTGPEPIDCYLELHIEQGGVLEHASRNIGIVRAIVGMWRWDVAIDGVANHAGSTPMYLRDDALVKAAQLIVDTDRIVREVDPDMVGTVGCIYKVEPNVFNVTPGRVELTLEMRTTNSDSMASAYTQLISGYQSRELSCTPTFEQPPTAMDQDIQDAIRKSAEELDLTWMEMDSGAGHDAMTMASLTKTGMIFVPSVGGVSHSKEEFTRWKDVENGANVLLKTLLQVDASVPESANRHEVTAMGRNSRK